MKILGHVRPPLFGTFVMAVAIAGAWGGYWWHVGSTVFMIYIALLSWRGWYLIRKRRDQNKMLAQETHDALVKFQQLMEAEPKRQRDAAEAAKRN